MSKIYVITGASSGIGYKLANYFHKNNNHVIGLSRHLPIKPHPFDYTLADISDEEQLQKAVDYITNKYGKVDVLINCAGIGISGALEYTEKKEAEDILRINVMGPFLTTKAFLPLLRKTKKAKIINIGSVAGELTIPFQTFYSMTKKAVQAFTEGLKLELKPFGIDACCVLPGDTKTDFTKNRKPPVILEDSIYKDRIKRSIAKMEKDEQNGMDPIAVVKTVKRVLKRKNMPVMVTVGITYKLFVFLNRILPKRLVSSLLYNMYSK
jgi:short-subunit dehydrogenase